MVRCDVGHFAAGNRVLNGTFFPDCGGCSSRQICPRDALTPTNTFHRNSDPTVGLNTSSFRKRPEADGTTRIATSTQFLPECRSARPASRLAPLNVGGGC